LIPQATKFFALAS